MALIESNMMPLGTIAPDFSLLNPRSGKSSSLAELEGGKGTLVMFICNHCPYVKHMESALIALGEQYADSGIGIVAISATMPKAIHRMAPRRWRRRGIRFPICLMRVSRWRKPTVPNAHRISSSLIAS